MRRHVRILWREQGPIIVFIIVVVVGTTLLAWYSSISSPWQ